MTLVGAGILGGEVIADGNVTISGSDSRIRGTTITGDLAIPGSGVGLGFSQVDGTAESEGSDATFLAYDFCGGATLTGSGTVVLGNVGIAPARSSWSARMPRPIPADRLPAFSAADGGLSEAAIEGARARFGPNDIIETAGSPVLD